MQNLRRLFNCIVKACAALRPRLRAVFSFCSTPTIDIDYDKLSKEQFVTLVEILKISKHLKSPINQRGKARPQLQHGKGKRKRK